MSICKAEHSRLSRGQIKVRNILGNGTNYLSDCSAEEFVNLSYLLRIASGGVLGD